jgi:hypothetical protein
MLVNVVVGSPKAASSAEPADRVARCRKGAVVTPFADGLSDRLSFNG